MLFAAALGEDDVKLFRWHAKERGWPGRIVEIRVRLRRWQRVVLRPGLFWVTRHAFPPA